MLKKIFFLSPFLNVFISFNVYAQGVSYEEFKNIEKVDLEVGHCELSIQASSNDRTKVVFEQGEEEFDVNVDNKILEVKRHISKQFLGLKSYESDKLVKLTLFIAHSVKNISYLMRSGKLVINDVNTNVFGNSGSASIDINKVKGDLALNTGSVNFKLNNINGNVKLNTGSFDGVLNNINGCVDLSTGSFRGILTKIGGDILLHTGSVKAVFEDVWGNIDLHGGSCEIDYKMSRKPAFPIKLNFHCGSFNCNSKLSDDFLSVSNGLKKIRIIRSFVKIVEHSADINFLGSTGSGELSIDRL